jgi:hypothetical protein
MKIVYINQYNIPDVVAEKIKEINPSYDHKSLMKAMDSTLRQGFYSRKGVNSLPFDYDESFFKAGMPDLQANYKKSFNEITDQRCCDLIKSHSDRPWLIAWSGGIDSTVILSSVLKNLSAEQRKNITVSYNKISVYENPRFFHDHVRPNFKLIDSTTQEFGSLLDTHYILDGDPADMLQGSGFALNAKSWGLNLEDSWQQSGPLVDFLTTVMGKDAAIWTYDHMAQNLDSLRDDPLQLETYADWFWWINFNWKWTANRLHEMQRQPIPNVKPYFSSAVHWYDTMDYQQWSMTQGRYSLIRDGGSLGSYKKVSKQYIYEFDQDAHYLKFKTKTDSDSRGPRHKKTSWFCVLDDYSTLTLEDDLDRIIELLPTHINQSHR